MRMANKSPEAKRGRTEGKSNSPKLSTRSTRSLHGEEEAGCGCTGEEEDGV